MIDHHALTLAIYSAFRQQGQYVKPLCELDEPDDLYSVIMDGGFDFHKVADDVISILSDK